MTAIRYVLGIYIAALVGLAMWARFTHSHLTEPQFLMAFWPYYVALGLPAVVGALSVWHMDRRSH